MSFHIDVLRSALVEAALIALDRATPPIQFIALALSEDALLPRALVTAPGLSLLLGVADPPEPDFTALAQATRLKIDALDLEDGVGRDLLLVAFIDAAEATAAAALARGLTPQRVPAGFQEPDELDLLDADAREVLWEDLGEGLKRLPAASKALIAEFFFLDPTERAAFLAALR
jgi:hypothetical protein